MAILKFPKGFLWGSATSAYQVEGGIENNDWSKSFPAGKACDHYNRYEEDFELVQQLNQNAHRFSLEWSRIEPEEGVFDEKEIEHYKNVLQSLKQKNISTMVTLHHFTTPLWLADMGGWSNKKAVFYFSRFAEKVFKEYRDLVDFWITINEPINYAHAGYMEGRWAPQKKNLFSFLKVLRNQVIAHKKVYTAFHTQSPKVRVSIAKGYDFVEPFSKSSLLDKISVRIVHYMHDHYFLNRVKHHLDFIGINYYFHTKIKFPFQIHVEGDVVSDISWEIYPEGIYNVLKDAQRYNVPVYITENGLADAQDSLRKNFIRDHLKWIHKAISEGVDVRGYFHWSFMDNFEWERGFDSRFGLVEVDYNTFKRTPRASAEYYAYISKTNQLEV